MKKEAFTLAEVLITLGIIGIIAAITLPVISHKHNALIVETRLKKIYSSMNEAIMLSEIENGPKEDWAMCDSSINDNADSAEKTPVENCKPYFEQYFGKYLNSIKAETMDDFNALDYQYIKIGFLDGSLLVAKFATLGIDFFFYPESKKFNDEDFIERKNRGKDMFMFRFAPALCNDINKLGCGKGFTTYTWGMESFTKEGCLKGIYACKEGGLNAYCTTLIQLNGWKIPDDYPYKF